MPAKLRRLVAPTPGTTDLTLWTCIGAVVSSVLLALGTLYTLGGLTVTASDKAYEVVTILPGGMRTHGAIMLTAGAVLLASLVAMHRTNDARHALRALYVSCAYSVWLVYAFTAAGLIAHAKVGAPLVWWLAGVALNVILIVRRPSRRERRVL